MATQKETLQALVGDVEVLKSRVAALEEKKQPLDVVGTPTVAEITTTPKYPVPPDFVAVVDEVLNKNFGIELEPLPDTAGYLLSIIVPDKYSNMTPAQKQMNGRDVRPKVISFSDGANGVRLWADKVLNNFDKDTQFRIVEDRPFASRPI